MKLAIGQWCRIITEASDSLCQMGFARVKKGSVGEIVACTDFAVGGQYLVRFDSSAILIEEYESQDPPGDYENHGYSEENVVWICYHDIVTVSPLELLAMLDEISDRG